MLSVNTVFMYKTVAFVSFSTCFYKFKYKRHTKLPIKKVIMNCIKKYFTLKESANLKLTSKQKKIFV